MVPAPCPQLPPGTRCSIAMATRMALKEDEGEREHAGGSEGESQVDRQQSGQIGPETPAMVAAAAPVDEGTICSKSCRWGREKMPCDGDIRAFRGPPPLSSTPQGLGVPCSTPSCCVWGQGGPR